jgi:ferrous iron transport protein A
MEVAMNPSGAIAPLDRWPTGQAAEVVDVQVPREHADWAVQLADLGFMPGEAVRIMQRAPFGGDPLVVRIGQSTFALRAAEAACIRVQPLIT